MSEEVTIFTEVTDTSNKSCKVTHWITLGRGDSEVLDNENKFSKAIFKANYTLVFVSIAAIEEYPLNGKNISGMKTKDFNEKVISRLGF